MKSLQFPLRRFRLIRSRDLVMLLGVLSAPVIFAPGCDLQGLKEHPRAVTPLPSGGELPAGSPGGGGGAAAPGIDPGGAGGNGGAGGAARDAGSGRDQAGRRDAGSGGGGRTTAPDATPAGPPPAGAGIDINGQWVPKDKAVVFIHFGHSNMAGLADIPAALTSYFFTTGPRLWSYQGGGRFVAAKEPTAPDPPFHLGAGPGMAWLRAASAAAGPDFHFISIGRGKGSAPSPDFMKNGLYYDSFMNRAIELRGKVTFGGLFIMLGITERHMPLDQQSGYTGRMAQIIADIRQDLGEPNLPVLHTDYEMEASGDLGPDTPVGMRLRPLILALPGKVSNLALIPTNQLPMLDDHHFDMTGHKMWADRGIQIMIDRGWFPYH